MPQLAFCVPSSQQAKPQTEEDHHSGHELRQYTLGYLEAMEAVSYLRPMIPCAWPVLHMSQTWTFCSTSTTHALTDLSAPGGQGSLSLASALPSAEAQSKLNKEYHELWLCFAQGLGYHKHRNPTRVRILGSGPDRAAEVLECQEPSACKASGPAHSRGRHPRCCWHCKIPLLSCSSVGQALSPVAHMPAHKEPPSSAANYGT